MTNKQLAAARAVMSQFPDLRVAKENDVLTPIARGGQRGEAVTVTASMTESVLTAALRTSCKALASG